MVNLTFYSLLSPLKRFLIIARYFLKLLLALSNLQFFRPKIGDMYERHVLEFFIALGFLNISFLKTKYNNNERPIKYITLQEYQNS